MNRDDITAYKNWDNNQYSLVPGVSKNKMIMVRDHKNEAKNAQTQMDGSYNKHITFSAADPRFQVEQERIKNLGHSRDPRDAMTVPLNMVQ